MGNLTTIAPQRISRRNKPKEPTPQAIRFWEWARRGVPVKQIAEKAGLHRTEVYRQIRTVNRWRKLELFSHDVELKERQIINALSDFADILLQDYVKLPADKKNPGLAMAYVKAISELRTTVGIGAKTTRIQNSVNVLHHVDMTGLPPETVAELRKAARSVRRAIDVEPVDSSTLPDAPSDATTHAREADDVADAGE